MIVFLFLLSINNFISNHDVNNFKTQTNPQELIDIDALRRKYLDMKLLIDKRNKNTIILICSMWLICFVFWFCAGVAIYSCAFKDNDRDVLADCFGSNRLV